MSNLKEGIKDEIQFMLESMANGGYPGEFDWIEKLWENEELYQIVLDDVADSFNDDEYIWERINETLEFYINSHEDVIKLKGELDD